MDMAVFIHHHSSMSMKDVVLPSVYIVAILAMDMAVFIHHHSSMSMAMGIDAFIAEKLVVVQVVFIHQTETTIFKFPRNEDFLINSKYPPA